MRLRKTRKSAAFTLVELLVVIAIITLLMSMLLPAIQRVREAANRMQCASNLKQLGIACHHYANDHGGFPFNAITKNNSQYPYIPYSQGTAQNIPGQNGGTLGRCSVLVTILPYIEQEPLGTQWFFNVDWSDPLNVNNLVVNIKIYRCPSSDYNGKVIPAYATNYITPGNDAFAPPSYSGSSTNIYGKKLYPTAKTTCQGWSSDYAPLCQVKTLKDANGMSVRAANPYLQAVYDPSCPSPGAMRQNAPTPITDIYDGTSNTTLFSEAAGRDMQWYANRVSVPYDPNNNTGMIWADSDNRLTVTGTDATGRNNIGTGPYVINCNNLDGDIYSFHTHGANIGFADGSVRFIADTMMIVPLAAIVTRNNGEIVQLEDYE